MSNLNPYAFSFEFFFFHSCDGVVVVVLATDADDGS